MKIVQFGLLALLSILSTGVYSKEQPRMMDEGARILRVSQSSAEEGWKGEVSEIDREIDKLVNQRNLYLAKATRLQNQGDRLQFENDDNLIDARRAWQQAQIHREIATRIQEEINMLEQRKQKILQAHGVNAPAK